MLLKSNLSCIRLNDQFFEIGAPIEQNINFISQNNFQYQIKEASEENLMNTGGLEFKKFKNQFVVNTTIPRFNTVKMVEPIQDYQKKSQANNRTPQKPPTSFRELSGSRDKNKLFSGKKSGLQSKLNTLRSNEKKIQQKNLMLEDSKKQPQASKEGLFKRLLTSRSPSSIKKTLNFDESKGSTVGTKDSLGPNLSAFKDIVQNEQNTNYSNLALQKMASAGEKKQELKGLKFKAFPHKRTNGNNPHAKNPSHAAILLSEGPLILQKGRSRSKGNKQESVGVGQKAKPFNLGKVIGNKVEKHKTLLVLNGSGISGPDNSKTEELDHDHEEVVRSRQGSLVFDMSPTLC